MTVGIDYASTHNVWMEVVSSVWAFFTLRGMQSCLVENIQSQVRSDLGDVIERGKVRKRADRIMKGTYREKEKHKKEGLQKRQRSWSQRDGWGERIWMRRERKCFCKRRLIKDLPKMPVTLRVPLWLLIWKLMLLIWGFRGDVQLEVVVEQLMSCWRRLGSRAMVIVVRNNVISFLAQPWLYSTCGLKLLQRGNFLFDITFDDACQVKLIAVAQ